MQYFIEIFTPTKFHEILHHYSSPRLLGGTLQWPHVTTSGNVWAGPQWDYGLCNGGECVSFLSLLVVN